MRAGAAPGALPAPSRFMSEAVIVRTPRAGSAIRSGFPMLAFLRFSSRDDPDFALPLPVYRALIESLFKGAVKNSINVVAYVLLAAYLFSKTLNSGIAVAATAVAAAGLARMVFEHWQHRRFHERGGLRLATIDDIRHGEAGYFAVMAAFALALGALLFFVVVADGNDNDRLLTLGACTAFLVSSPARCSGSPRIVAVQAWLIAVPFSTALIVAKDGYFGVLMSLMVLRHLRDTTKSLHGEQVSMLMARRDAEDVADKFDTALNNMTRGLVMIDRDYRVQVANRQFAEIFGLAAPPVDLPLRQLFDKFIAPLIGQYETVTAVRGFFVGHSGAERELRLADGRILALTRQPMPQGSVITAADVTAEHEAEENIQRMARFDPVSGLPNRASFSERLAAALDPEAGSARFSLLSIDLDHFKEVNDSHGHQVGDLLLALVGARLLEATENGFVARIGGDEFAVLAPIADRELIAGIGAAIVRALSQPFEIEARIVRIGASIGAAVFPDHAEDGAADSLIKAADMALYSAKAAGRGTVSFFAEEMAHSIRRRRQIGEELRGAVGRGELSLAYQPIVDVADRSVIAVEALLRWSHPEFGAVPPGEFVPIAEENATIIDIGGFVLRQACRDATAWPDSVRVAVNLSALQFERGDLIAAVLAALAESGLPPHRLELEITESILIRNHDIVFAALNKLHALGAHIALDDFGAGYSSLSYLNDFPFDKVKIDRGFIRDIDTPKGAKAASIIRAVNAIGTDLGMSVVAEGVETWDQLAAIRALGVRGAQGDVFSRPVRAEDMGLYLLQQIFGKARPAPPEPEAGAKAV
jgi:diguanylate cyclase (GGDEF)-like protein